MRCASRSLSSWLPGAEADAESSLPDLIFLSALIVMGITVLSRRRINWSSMVSGNSWLVILFAYILISVVWSDITEISLKRWIRTSGDLIMVLVILTESNPLEGITTVFRRCFILLIPLSIVFCKYFPNIGKLEGKFEPDMWIGVATHKNTLGPLILLSCFYYIWDLVENSNKCNRLINIVYILMSIYLLNGNGYNRSATSILLLLVALSLYVFLRRYKKNPKRLRVVVTCSIIAVCTIFITDQVVLDSALKNSLIEMQGRDPTLTGRSLLWHDLFVLGMKKPTLGYGFAGFWTPDRMAYLKGLHPWGPGESHNGYIEIFITTGIIGLILFGFVVISAMKGALQQCILHFEYGLLRTIFLIVVLVQNYSESAFLRPTHFIWFLFLLMAVNVPYTQPRIASMSHDLPMHRSYRTFLYRKTAYNNLEETR